MSSNVSVTGVATTPGPRGEFPVRREIRDLQDNYKDQFNLYLLALAKFKNKIVTDVLSYYQIAGIHGEPYIPWDGVEGNEEAVFGGYCTHSSILFLTWHRPYLALYEQALYAAVQDIALQYPESLRERYQAAAKDFRMPYWDWAQRIIGQASAFPTAVSSKTIEVVDVDGESKQIDNPLYTFRFDDKKIPSKLAIDKHWTDFGSTKRTPDSSGNSQDALVSQIITNEAASLRNNVSLLLLSYKQFDAVSNNLWAGGNKAGQYGSIEDVHNEIHDKVGGAGHMSSLDASAFDPVFWLHHTNVDRLWAIWQALNPDAYVIDKIAQANEANFTIASGSHITAKTSLEPFYDASATNFWDSASVKYTTPFGHAYPETQRWLYTSDQDYQTAVRTQVTKEYGANVINNFFTDVASTPKPASSEKKLAETRGMQAQIALHRDAKSKPSTDLGKSLTIPKEFEHLVTDRTYTEWITNIRAQKHGLQQTFRVYVFLGDFPADPSAWPTAYNVVGRFTVLGRGPTTGCAKCKKDATEQLVVSGTVPLTSALLQDILGGQLSSLEPVDVEDYLVRNLHWRVTNFAGEEVERAEVPGLKVSVVSTKVSIGDDGVPLHSDVYETHQMITDGRPTGVGSDDEI